MDVGCLLNKIGRSHYIRGCHWVASGCVEFAMGIFDHGGELIGELGLLLLLTGGWGEGRQMVTCIASSDT